MSQCKMVMLGADRNINARLMFWQINVRFQACVCVSVCVCVRVCVIA